MNAQFKAYRRNGMTKSNYNGGENTISSTSSIHLSKVDGNLKSQYVEQTRNPDSTKIAQVLTSTCMIQKAIEFGFPDHITLMLAKRFPSSLTQADELGRYPIHTACKNGASARLAALCIYSNPTSVLAKDIENKTPLQLLCKGTWKGPWSLTCNPSAEKHMLAILEILYLKAPASLVYEDSCGLGPIEDAINSNHSLKFIVALQEKIAHLNESGAQTSTKVCSDSAEESH